jgi:hypothetical protein
MHTFETALTVPLIIGLLTAAVALFPRLYTDVRQRAAAEAAAADRMSETDFLYKQESKNDLTWVVTHPPRLLRFLQMTEDLTGGGQADGQDGNRVFDAKEGGQ